MRRQSLASLANGTVPFPAAARWAGITVHEGSAERGIRAYCPFGEVGHPDGGRDPALRVYPDHGWCFACGKYFTPVSLLAEVWQLGREDAAAEALRRAGHVPVTYAHLFERAARPPEPDAGALAAALVTWCRARCPQWADAQYRPGVALALSRCLGLLPLVASEDDCATWLAACKQAMQRALDEGKLT